MLHWRALLLHVVTVSGRLQCASRAPTTSSQSSPTARTRSCRGSFGGGHDLSGGSWQRLGIARGIIREHATVLVADEPTAALDAKAEARVFAGLHRAITGSDDTQRTTILVTHRLANIRHADRIVVLDSGRIVETGTHEDLMDGNGLYRELYSIQARAYPEGVCRTCSAAPNRE